MFSYVPEGPVTTTFSERNPVTGLLLRKAEEKEVEERQDVLTSSFDHVDSSLRSPGRLSRKSVVGLRDDPDRFSQSQMIPNINENRPVVKHSVSYQEKNPSQKNIDSLLWLQSQRLHKEPIFQGRQSTFHVHPNQLAQNTIAPHRYPIYNSADPWWQTSVPVSYCRDSGKPTEVFVTKFDQSLSSRSNEFLDFSTDQSSIDSRFGSQNPYFAFPRQLFPDFPPVSSLDPHTNICNIFWKSSLTFHPYVYGNKLVIFGALWPGEQELKLLLADAYQDSGVRRLVSDIAWIAVHCGPLRVLKVMLQLKLIGLAHRFDDGQTLLHKCCVAQNLSGALYLSQSGVKPHATDKSGRTADQVCFSDRIMKVLTEDGNSLYGRVAMDTYGHKFQDKVKATPSLHDKQLMFDLAKNCKDTDELLVKLQMFDFDVNRETDEKGDYLIHIATKQGICQVPLMQLLKKICQANINLRNQEGYTVLMLCALMGDVTLVDTLLCVFGADPDMKNDQTGRTALHYACQRNDTEIVSTLIKRGADCNLEDSDGARPDDLGTIFRATDCVELIRSQREQRIKQLSSLVEQDDLKPADVRTTDLFLTGSEGYTLIMLAAKNNSCTSLEWMVKVPDAPVDAQHEHTLKTALSYAAKFGHTMAITILMRQGANSIIRDVNSNLPVHNAAIHHQVAALIELLQYSTTFTVISEGLYKALQLSRHPVIQKEIRNAMQSRQKNIVQPLLFECSVSGNAEKLFQVLEDGDNVNQQSGVGDWPLYLAVENGHLEVVKLLYELGGDADKRHQQTGNSVLHASCSRGQISITEFLLDKCQKCTANQNSSLESGQSAHCRSRKEEPGGIINALNFNKETPVMLAANKGYAKLVSLLLSRGATTSLLNPVTGYPYVCSYEGVQYVLERHRNKHTEEILAAIKDWKPVKKLKDVFLPQFDHNLRNSRGDTPLMMACALSKIDAVRYLVQTAVYEVFPSPPSTHKITMCCYDSDADSGAVLDTQNNTQSTFHSQGPLLPDQPLCTSTPIVKSQNATQQEVSKDFKSLLPRTATGDLRCILEQNEETKPNKIGETPLEENDEAVPPFDLPPSASFYIPPDTEAEEECTVRDNISTLLDSIASVSRGSVFVNNKKVSHLCATSLRDGATAYHHTIEGGDNAGILRVLLEVDQSAVNIQDQNGVSPLHLACKLGRRRILEILLSVPFVDLNSRTLDGKLPEEMSRKKSIISLVVKSRNHQPINKPFSVLRTLSTSLFGGSTYSDDENSIDFDMLNTRFMLLKQDVTSDMSVFM